MNADTDNLTVDKLLAARSLVRFTRALGEGAVLLVNRSDVEEEFPNVPIDERGRCVIHGRNVQTSRHTPRGKAFTLPLRSDERRELGI